MKISNKSLLVRNAYLVSIDGPPCRTSLCAIFWRTVITNIGIVLFALFPVAYTVTEIIVNPREFFIALGLVLLFVTGIAGLITGVLGLEHLHRKFKNWYNDITETEIVDAPLTSLEGFVKGAIAVKDKFCPVIEIERKYSSD